MFSYIGRHNNCFNTDVKRLAPFTPVKRRVIKLIKNVYDFLISSKATRNFGAIVMHWKIIITNFIAAFVIFLIWLATAYLSGWLFDKDGNYIKAILIVNVSILLALFIGATIRSSIEISQDTKLKADETKWAPAREIVVRSLAKAYNTSFHAANQLMDFNYRDFNLQNTDKFKGKSVYLEAALQDFQKLQKNVQLNNTALGPDLMPVVSTFVDASDNLLKKLKYYLLIHNQEYMDRDFVSEPPFGELETMENIAVKLREKYEGIFNDKHIVYTYLKTFAEIKDAWEKAAISAERLFFQPSSYQYRKNRVPFLYDIKNLEALSVEEAQDGVKVQVYSIY